MKKTIKTIMTELPEVSHKLDWDYFTIGKGKKPYHLWTCNGSSGLYYVYRQVEFSLAVEGRRAVEPTKEVVIHLK